MTDDQAPPLDPNDDGRDPSSTPRTPEGQRAADSPPSRKRARRPPRSNGATTHPAIVDDESDHGATGECTDLHNSECLAAWHGAELRHVARWEKWLAWDGARWCEDQGAVARAAAETSRRLLVDAQRQRDEAERSGTRADREVGESLVKHALKSQSARLIDAMIKVARSMQALAIEHTALDVHQWLLNVVNGTIDLRTGELRRHRRGDLITKLAPVAFDADANCPTWDAFIDLAMGGDAKLVAYLARLVGYGMTGSTREHVLAFFFGDGANGKSTFLGTIHAMLGDYVRAAPRGLLFASRQSQHPTELAALHGARFVTCSEIKDGHVFDEAKVKDLTGGDPITARRMHEDFWTFRPTHKLFIAGNHKPTVRGTDEGIWRRIRLVPWAVKIPTEDRDPDLPEKLLAELPGILAWAVRGAVDWYANGLGDPPAVREATAAYRAESDRVADFFGYHVAIDPAGRVTRKLLRAEYERWCAENGERHPLDAKAFADAVRTRGAVEGSVRDVDTKPVRGWHGIRLSTEAERASGFRTVAEPREVAR